MRFSRREVLGLGVGAAALWATGAGASAAVRPKRRVKAAAAAAKIPIGLQLYSVRKDCEKDLPGVLEAVAKMGYVGVEFAGYYGRKADELRKLLDKNGLKCCGTHTGPEHPDRRRLERDRRVQQDHRQQVPHRAEPAREERGVQGGDHLHRQALHRSGGQGEGSRDVRRLPCPPRRFYQEVRRRDRVGHPATATPARTW